MSRLIRARPRLFGLIGLLMAVLLLSETVVLAATLAKNGGPVRAVRTVSATEFVDTNSEDWVDMPGMSVSVNVPSGEKGLLVVTFSALTWCQAPSDTDYGLIQVVVDGSTVADPGAMPFCAGGTPNIEHANSMQYVAGPVNAGTHTVKVQWKVPNATTYFRAWGRMLTVLRSKV